MKTKQTTSVNSRIRRNFPNPNDHPFQTRQFNSQTSTPPAPSPSAPKTRRRRAETPTKTPIFHRCIFSQRVYPICTPKPPRATRPTRTITRSPKIQPTARGFPPQNSQRSVPRTTDDDANPASDPSRARTGRGILSTVTQPVAPNPEPVATGVNRPSQHQHQARSPIQHHGARNRNAKSKILSFDRSPRSTPTRPFTRWKPKRKNINVNERTRGAVVVVVVVVVVATHHLHKQQVFECRHAPELTP